MNGDRAIQFVNSRYEDLFSIPDGSYISITQKGFYGGEDVSVIQCRYIDEEHLLIGDMIYGNHEFAVYMKRIGAKFYPEPEPETIDCCIVVKRVSIGDKVFFIASNPGAKSLYFTIHRYKDITKGYSAKQYFTSMQDAQDSLSQHMSAYYEYMKCVKLLSRGVPRGYTQYINSLNAMENER